MSHRNKRKIKDEKPNNNDDEIKKRLDKSNTINTLINLKNMLSTPDDNLNFDDIDNQFDTMTLNLFISFLENSGSSFVRLYINLIDRTAFACVLPESIMASPITRKILLDIANPNCKKELLSIDLSNISDLSIDGIYTINVDTQVDKHKFIVITKGDESCYIGSYGIHDKFSIHKTTSLKLISYIQRAYQNPVDNNLTVKRIAMNLLLTGMQHKEYFTDDFVLAECTTFKLKRTNLTIQDFDQIKIDKLRLRFLHSEKDTRDELKRQYDPRTDIINTY
jgi:hypothetical protein